MYRNPKRSLNFLQNQVINGMRTILDLLGLLYCSTVDRKDILEMQYYQLPMHLVNWQVQKHVLRIAIWLNSAL